MTYVFYDTETTGIEVNFDQILQFAAIKTDDNFEELDHLNVRCRLLPHVIPSPKALCVTRVRPKTLTDSELPSHYEAVRQIRARLLDWSPATFVGFNSLHFDERLLRQAFFQTLHPACLTNTNGNARFDAMRLLVAADAYAPGSISVPTGDKGRRKFTLGDIATSNGYDHSDAHEAMADVRATIHVTRLARDRAPDIWRAMKNASTKDGVKEYVSKQPVFSLTDRFFGKTRSWLVAPCGRDPDDDDQIATFDLHNNPDDYCSLPAEKLAAVLSGSPKVIRIFRANSQPVMMPPDAAPKDAGALLLSPEERQRRIAVIRRDSDFQKRIWEARKLNEQAAPVHLEERIYHDGFPAEDDQLLMERFHNVDWEERAPLVKQIKDARVKEFARRLMYFERPDLLSAGEASRLKAWCADRVQTEDEVPWTTVGKAMREVDDCLKGADDDEVALLGEIREFLVERAKAVNAGG